MAEQVEPAGARDEAWAKARDGARALLEGTERFRVPGASPDVELSALDFGGEGPLILMHHANGFCGATLAAAAAPLRDRYRVIALDARGHGDSTPVPEGGRPNPYSWETLGADLESATEAILDRVGADRVALAVGHSIGGALWLRAAARLGDRVARILLCDPGIPPPPSAEVPNLGRHAAIAEALRKRRDHWPDFEEAFMHLRTRGLFKAFPPESLALYILEGLHETADGQVTLKCDRTVEAAIFEGDGIDGTPDIVPQVSARVVFVHALRGNFSAETYETVARTMPDASVQSLDADHLFPLEEPHRVLELIESSFGRLDD
jgi:pimeloyl-ACP methyl ester carboxylesterase